MQGRRQEAWRALYIATGHIEGALLTEQPQLMEDIDTMLGQWLVLADEPRIAYKLLEHVSNMSNIVLGRSHPITQIYTHLSKMDSCALKHILKIVRQSLIDRFAHKSSKLNNVSLYLQARNIQWDASDTALQAYWKINQECVKSLDSTHERSLNLQYGWGCYCLSHHQYSEALEMAQNVLAETALDYTQRSSFSEMLATAQYLLGLRDNTLQILRGAIAIFVDKSGWESGDDVLGLVIRLVTWLEGLSRPEEAAAARRQYEILVERRDARYKQKEEERYQHLMKVQDQA